MVPASGGYRTDMVMEIKKSAGLIIRDDVRRRKHMRAGLGIIFLSILLLLGITYLYPQGGDVTGVIGLMSLGSTLAGCVISFASERCAICDSMISKSGACNCQPSRAARSAHINNLKKGAAGPDSHGGP